MRSLAELPNFEDFWNRNWSPHAANLAVVAVVVVVVVVVVVGDVS